MFSALTQRFARATTSSASSQTLSTEPAEFEQKYARLLQVRDTIKKVEAGLKLHLKKSHALSKQAKQLGKLLGTSEQELKRLTEELNTVLEEDILVQAITSKIQLLDDTVKQRRKLEDMRLVRDHHQQRLAQAQSKLQTSASTDETKKLQAEVDKRQAKLDTAQQEYDSHLAELSDALHFIDEQTSRDGPWALVAVELEAFRAAAQRTSNNVLALFAGAAPGTYRRDVEAEKAAVRDEEAAAANGGAAPPAATKKDEDEDDDDE